MIEAIQTEEKLFPCSEQGEYMIHLLFDTKKIMVLGMLAVKIESFKNNTQVSKYL